MKYNLSFYLKSIGIAFILGFIVFTGINRCNKSPVNINPPIINVLQAKTPTTQEQQVVPQGHVAVVTIKPKKVVEQRWERIDTSIVVSVDQKCNTCVAYTQIDNTKTFIGFSFVPKVYLAYVNDEFSLGYDQEIFRIAKFSFDGLISFPYLGIGSSYNITNNFFVIGGLQIKYIQYESIDKIGTYWFSVNELKKIYPLIGLGFNF